MILKWILELEVCLTQEKSILEFASNCAVEYYSVWSPVHCTSGVSKSSVLQQCVQFCVSNYCRCVSEGGMNKLIHSHLTLLICTLVYSSVL